MNSEWETVKLGDLCELTKGTSPTQKTLPGEYSLVVTGAVPLTSSEYQFEGEAVCIPMVSSTGHGHASLKRVHYASGRFAAANIITVCEVKEPGLCSTRFLYLYLQHLKDELIVPLMKGTANVSLSQRALATVPIQLPPLTEQRRIVDLIGALDDTIEAASASVAESEILTSRYRETAFLPSSASDRFRIGDLLSKVRLPVDVDAEMEYTEVGIRSHGRGVFIKKPVSGQDLGRKKVFHMTPGCIAFSVVFSWEGAVALLGDEVEGKIASHRFPNYEGSAPYAAQLLNEYFKTQSGRQVLVDCSPGGAGRNKTLNQGALMETSIPFPLKEKWPDVVDNLTAIAAYSTAGKSHLEALHSLRSNILTSLLSGAHEIPESYDELLFAS